MPLQRRVEALGRNSRLARGKALERGDKRLARTGFKPPSVEALARARKPKPRRALPFRSAKQTAIQDDLARITAEWKAIDPSCHVRSPVCTHKMDCLHHVIARSVRPDLVLVLGNLLRSCDACNMYVETADGARWAEANGKKKRSYEWSN